MVQRLAGSATSSLSGVFTLKLDHPDTSANRSKLVLPTALIFLAVTFAFMPRPLLGQRTYGAVDMVELGSPYRDAIERPPDLASPDTIEVLSSEPSSTTRTSQSGTWVARSSSTPGREASSLRAGMMMSVRRSDIRRHSSLPPKR